jgi:hypothetical protein
MAAAAARKYYPGFEAPRPPVATRPTPAPLQVWREREKQDRYEDLEDEASEADDDDSKEDELKASAKSVAQAVVLQRLAAQLARFMRTSDGTIYARVPVDGRQCTVSCGVTGSEFRVWLIYAFSQMYHRAPNPAAVKQALDTIRATAAFTAEVAEPFIRLGEANGAVYLDLATDAGEVVRITKEGWEITASPPVYFRRSKAMLPLPRPERGGSLDELRSIINAGDNASWALIAAWLVGTLHPHGPYPVLAICGERGSGKSVSTTVLRCLIDPSKAPSRSLPKDDRDAAVMAHNSWIPAFDNLSHLPDWVSDFICRVSTGAGYSVRANYTDDEETVFYSKRPVIFNGIEDLASRGDLLDRSLVISLPTIQDRREEEEVLQRFHEAHPRLLGALLDAVVCALSRRDTVKLDRPPRMADFAKWAIAAEPGLGLSTSFMGAYERNREVATSIAIESSPVGQAIMFLMKVRTEWSGTMTELYSTLSRQNAGEAEANRMWPRSARGLSQAISRIATDLRTNSGIHVQSSRTKAGSMVSITRIEVGGDEPEPPVEEGEEDWQAFASPCVASLARSRENPATGDGAVTQVLPVTQNPLILSGES